MHLWDMIRDLRTVVLKLFITGDALSLKTIKSSSIPYCLGNWSFLEPRKNIPEFMTCLEFMKFIPKLFPQNGELYSILKTRSRKHTHGQKSEGGGMVTCECITPSFVGL